MNKIVLSFAFILFTLLSMGQSTLRQSVGLSIGASIPMQDFAKTSLSDSTSGFAKTGVALNFNYDYRLTHNFGFQLLINYSSNKLDNVAWANGLESLHPGYGVTVESTKNWSSGGMFAGPFLRFPVGDWFSFHVRGLIGYFSSFSPQATIYAASKTNTSDKATYYRETASAGGFGTVLGAGVRYRMSKYTLMVYGDYMGSSLNFKDASGWDWDSEPYQTTFSQKINYLSITVGLAYLL